MGAIRDSLETSLSVAVELGRVDVREHAGIIAGARSVADDLDRGEIKGRASMLATYLSYCKLLGIVPAQARAQEPVVGQGRLASLRSGSRSGLRAV